jgi:L-ectoine synthase
MIVRTLEDATQTDRRVRAANWESVRLLLASDGMGFSLHVTTLFAGTTTEMWYRHHLEAVLCISGEGELEELDGNIVYAIRPGTMYALDHHDKHILRAKTTMRAVCVFTPPLKGKEVHDASGAYPLDAEAIVGEAVSANRAAEQRR